MESAVRAQLPHSRLHFAIQILVLLFAALSAGAAAQSLPAADTLVVNARLYTVNSRQPWAEALAVRGGNIVAVGTAAQIEKYRGPSTRVIDAGGRLILPGFTDCHIHFMDGSLSLQRINVDRKSTRLNSSHPSISYAVFC